MFLKTSFSLGTNDRFFLTTKQTSSPGTILCFDEKSQWRNSRKIELALVKTITVNVLDETIWGGEELIHFQKL